MNVNPVFSIIIPVFNVEKFLHRCISSIIEQTYTEWELILVDDGSIDTSGEICDYYANNYSKITAIHTENGGVSSARNIGLQVAKGEWIVFVDSDDTVSNDYLKNLSEKIDCRADLLFIGYRSCNESGKTLRVYRYNEGLYIGQDKKQCLPQVIKIGTPWGKAYRRSVLEDHNIRFDTRLRISEDRVFMYNFLVFAQGLSFSNAIGYNYLINEGSLTFSKKDPQQYFLRLRALEVYSIKVFDSWELALVDYLPFWNFHLSMAIDAYQKAMVKGFSCSNLNYFVGNWIDDKISSVSRADSRKIKKTLGYARYYLSLHYEKKYFLLDSINRLLSMPKLAIIKILSTSKRLLGLDK